MNRLKLVKLFLVSVAMVMFTACGSSSSKGPTKQDIAIEKIANYAQYGEAVPVLSDYEDAGVVRVTPENIDYINEVIRGLSYTDVDTQEKIQAIVDELDIDIPDTTSPIITLNGDNPTELIKGTPYTEAGATATDDREGIVNVTIAGSVDTNKVGTYIITYTATDSAGNTATATRTVKIVDTSTPDTTKPIITLKGSNPMVLIRWTPYTEAGGNRQR